MCTITFRLSGPPVAIDLMQNALRSTPGVDRVEEMGNDAGRGDDDSSSAGLPDDMSSAARDVEIHAVSEVAAQAVRDRAEIAARDAGVVIEWLEPF